MAATCTMPTTGAAPTISPLLIIVSASSSGIHRNFSASLTSVGSPMWSAPRARYRWFSKSAAPTIGWKLNGYSIERGAMA
jgi:hypothetical protein